MWKAPDEDPSLYANICHNLIVQRNELNSSNPIYMNGCSWVHFRADHNTTDYVGMWGSCHSALDLCQGSQALRTKYSYDIAVTDNVYMIDRTDGIRTDPDRNLSNPYGIGLSGAGVRFERNIVRYRVNCYNYTAGRVSTLAEIMATTRAWAYFVRGSWASSLYSGIHLDHYIQDNTFIVSTTVTTLQGLWTSPARVRQ